MALGGQAPGLDRVGEDDGRTVLDLIGAAEGVEQVGEVVAAEVAHGGAELLVGQVLQQALDVAPRAALAGQALAQLGGSRAQ